MRDKIGRVTAILSRPKIIDGPSSSSVRALLPYARSAQTDLVVLGLDLKRIHVILD